MEELKIQELIAKCEAFFRENYYSETVIVQYRRRWQKGILKFMAEHGLENYSPSIGVKYLTCHHQDELVGRLETDRIKSIRVLDDMITTGMIRYRRTISIVQHLDGKIGQEMERFIDKLINLRRSKITIRNHRRHLSQFLAFLTQSGIKAIGEIAEVHILSFASSITTSKVEVVTTIRKLFRFWKEKGITDGRFDELFEVYKVKRRNRIASFYTIEEVEKMKRFINRNSPVGKRNYAMFLLASHLGLRASDIASLTFHEIDWEKNILTIQMKKTGNCIELPLLAEVGNAIIDYLRNGRPKSLSDYIFLGGCSPYSNVSSDMVYYAISQIILKSGVDVKGRRHGPHSLRFSLATAMLEKGTSISIISESLGHESTETTMDYLKIDIRSLAICVLPVPDVPEAFYTQKGGVFYG